MKEGAIIIDKKGVIQSSNAFVEDLIGFSTNELIGKNIQFLVKKKLETPIQTNVKITNKQGAVTQFHLYMKNNIDKTRTIILKERDDKRLLQEAKDQLKEMLDVSFNGIIVHHLGEILEINESSLTILGYEKEEIVGHSVWDLIRGKELLEKQYFSGCEDPVEVMGSKKDGNPVSLSVRERSFPFLGLDARVLAIEDLTEQKKQSSELAFLTNHDPLTGLRNHTSFTRQLNLEMAKSQLNKTNLVVMYCDCDGLKKINDTLGRSLGDQVIKEVAKRLIFLVGEENVSRLGADEFGLLLTNKTKAEVKSIAKQVVQAFEEPVIIDNYSLYLTLSIGISLYPEDGTNAEDLIKHADIAMFDVKKRSKNSYAFYQSAMSHRTFNLLTIESELRKAIDKDEFELFYQPQFDMKSNRITGAEALIRWNHGDLGMIPPNEFIPIAEESGLILPIGEWVLRTACMQNKLWESQGFEPIKMYVNFTAKQLQQSRLVEKVSRILFETGMEPERLGIEITELAAVGEREDIISSLAHLQSIGVTISIDDFGTGFCSFGYLKQFPINKIKIDKSFVMGIDQNRENQAITEAVVKLGQGLGLTVVAEGIETERECNYVKKLGCDEAQGYYFSRPVPSEQFHPYLNPA
ncbi:diguanylate cyclase/phosphodiesterase [Halalkalibacter wakoensis JCM 9140]|uniref:Diguanylate cyclase/phosphodiesterase n=1 Tax=Halalkalibacter wakoensis JCM 9140 TaxID=1236970 RepID=W4Q662_9BACI|nr:bifunctional diguanylate cyclase/phosphodiesterase [Halalkalibacter wakoensis]GAE27203.1 diguanylate cyclase/phosphodiesterase [Halalkalibacter wakoensis JCM 9140]